MEIVTIDHLNCFHSASEVKSFLRWMSHQTAGIMPSGHIAYYSHDYERWFNGLPIID